MAVKTGVDILTRAVDLTRQGLDSTIDRVRGIGREVKEANKAGGEFGAAFSALRGGAAVAGVALVADQLARASEGAVNLRDQMRRLDEPILQTSQNLLESVTGFGTIAVSGRRITESMFELVTGSEMLSREARAQASEYEKLNQLLGEGSVLAMQLWEAGDRRHRKPIAIASVGRSSDSVSRSGRPSGSRGRWSSSRGGPHRRRSGASKPCATPRTASSGSRTTALDAARRVPFASVAASKARRWLRCSGGTTNAAADRGTAAAACLRPDRGDRLTWSGDVYGVRTARRRIQCSAC